MIQIYSYSLACFIPGSILFVILAPFGRAKWFLTFSLTAMVCYYQYKEQIETCKRYLTYSKFIKMAIGLTIVNLFFALLVKSIISVS